MEPFRHKGSSRSSFIFKSVWTKDQDILQNLSLCVQQKRVSSTDLERHESSFLDELSVWACTAESMSFTVAIYT